METLRLQKNYTKEINFFENTKKVTNSIKLLCSGVKFATQRHALDA